MLRLSKQDTCVSAAEYVNLNLVLLKYELQHPFALIFFLLIALASYKPIYQSRWRENRLNFNCCSFFISLIIYFSHQNSVVPGVLQQMLYELLVPSGGHTLRSACAERSQINLCYYCHTDLINCIVNIGIG